MAVQWRFWRGLTTASTGAGSRPDGLQITNPLSYAMDAADTVTIDTAFQLSAVWACIRLISETIASMPINVYNVDAKGIRTPNTTHPIAKLFSGRPNRWQTRIEFFETLTMQLALQGNAYALIQRNGQGQIIGLIPLMSQEIETALGENGEIYHRRVFGGNMNVYSAEKIWHSKLFGNGIVGLSPLGYARNAIGIGQAGERAVTKIYSNGAKPSGILTIDKVLSDTQRAAIKANFSALEEGTQDRLFVLEAGMQYQQVSMTPQDIELLSTRRFQIEDIARFFGVPSVMINDTSTSTVWGSGIQQIVEGFYKLGVRPYLERYEESIKQWLVSAEDRDGIEIEFDFQEFLRPDQSERLKMYGEAVSKAIMTPNEARAMEGWAALAGGEQAFMQQQMIPIDMLGKIQQGKADNEVKMAENSDKPTHLVNVHLPEIKVDTPAINFKSGDITIPSTVNLPQSAINVQQPAIKMNPPAINVAAPVVNVAAPDINLNSPDVKVSVAAPNVQVTPTVNVKLPKRKTKTDVLYDSQDRISTTTQIEEDV